MNSSIQIPGTVQLSTSIIQKTKYHFDNLALRVLPLDRGSPHVRTVRDACFALVPPTPVDNPRLVVASKSVLDLLGLPTALADRGADDPELAGLVACLAGNALWPGSQPAAHCYCGHQFGSFAGQLGDGAVIYLGEVINDKSERWEIQLKGAGLTPFSRSADGRKVLRSSLREFLCSEAMHHLGIRSTRAASVITSDTLVERDKFYDGHVISEPAAVTCRVAPTFIRFGSFEITKPQDPATGRSGPSFGNLHIIAELTNYVIKEFFPQIWSQFEASSESPPVDLYLAFFEAVVKRTAELVACWQSVGFCHGVLNTDNMSIIGLTIDYGPFGFLDRFSWDHICNTSDPDGRYSYAQQPAVCRWNCLCLANCLLRGLIDVARSPGGRDPAELVGLRNQLADRFTGVLSGQFDATFERCYLQRMRSKLGLFVDKGPDDKSLCESLLNTMEKTGADFTNTFVALEHILEDASKDNCLVSSLCPDLLLEECCDVEELREALKPDERELQHRLLLQLAGISRHRLASLNANKVVSTEEKAARLEEIRHMTDTEKRVRDASLWQTWLHAYADRISADTSCQTIAPSVSDRLRLMRSANPRMVLRNHLAEWAIRAAESGDYRVARTLLEALQTPFETGEAVRQLANLWNDDRSLGAAERSTSPCQPPVATESAAETAQFMTQLPTSDLATKFRPPKWARNLRVS